MSEARGTYTLSHDRSISYDSESYRSYVQKLRDINRRLQTSSLSPHDTDIVLGILRDVVEATSGAFREIYNPLLDDDKVQKVISSIPNDYKTDLEGLSKLSEYL